MKVRVDVTVIESVYIEVDSEDEISEKAHDVAYDFVGFSGSVSDVGWEIIGGN